MSRLWNMSPLRVSMLSHSVMANSLWLMNCTPSGSSVHGVLQARILEWVAMSSSRGSSQPRDQTCIPYVSYIGRKVSYHMGSPITSPPLYYYSEYVFFTNQNGKKISLPHQKRKKKFSLSNQKSRSSVQCLSCVWLACQASLSITNSQSLLKFMSMESVMPSIISSSVVPFSSCSQSLPASGSFPVSQLFASSGQGLEFQLQRQPFQWTPRTDLL